MHVPVLLEKTIQALNPKEGEFIIDGTIDGGGHAEAILEKIGARGKLLGLDLDRSMLNGCRKKLGNRKNVTLEVGNYKDLPRILQEKKLGFADGLLLDLGFSSEQLVSGRGFSFEKDEPLLMTYGEEAMPARAWLKKLKEKELADILYNFGGERMSRQIAKAIKGAREINSSKELSDIIRKALPKNYERGRINPATRTFQALRIFVNGELENLNEVLQELPQIVRPGGRVAIISFHSLEDRLVKNEFKKLSKEGIAELIFKKPLVAEQNETMENPRSRSAKLRAIKIL